MTLSVPFTARAGDGAKTPNPVVAATAADPTVANDFAMNPRRVSVAILLSPSLSPRIDENRGDDDDDDGEWIGLLLVGTNPDTEVVAVLATTNNAAPETILMI